MLSDASFQHLAGASSTSTMQEGEATDVGIRVGGGGCADWWIGAVDLLVRTSPSQGANVADHIKEQLMERDRYTMNASFCES